MPEGHTVHRMAREQQELVGEVLQVTSPQGRFSREANLLDGRRLAGVEAKGKHLFHHFEDSEGAAHVHVHLGMQGKFFRAAPGRAPLRQARMRLESPCRQVVWELVAPATCELLDDAGLADLLGRLGPDPLRADADGEEARRRLAGDGRSIGSALLDQTVVSGVGNVFRAESLFACRIHPRVPAASLSDADLRCLWETLRAMMARAVDEGRILTVPAEAGGDRSAMDESDARFVYKQERCRRCGTPVLTEEIGGRTAYFCPSCQPEGALAPASARRLRA